MSFSSMIGSAPPENIEREIWKQHIDEWKRRIEDAYHANGYRTLADKYVSDFNRHRQTVEITEGLRLDFLKIPAIGVADVFDKWQSQEKESCSLLLGIDVGGTLVKFQFFRVVEGETGQVGYHPIGEAFRVRTPEPDQTETHLDVSLALKRTSEQFASALYEEVCRIVEHDEELYTELRKDRSRVICIGVAWPGAVRNNHVVGTSGILKRFPPLTRDILKNRIEDLLQFDIAGAIREVFTRSWLICKHKRPFVSFVNDGVAEGYGGIICADGASRKRIAFVKLGTGTALAAFQNGQTVDGIWEGGKLILDLAAVPRKSYPNGDASAMMSQRFLPDFAKLRLRKKDLDLLKDGYRFSADVLNSHEIGLLAKDNQENALPLVIECGLRDLAAAKDVDVEILRHIFDKGGSAEKRFLSDVARMFDKSGTVFIDDFRKIVRDHGSIRLSEVLGVRAQDINEFMDSLKTERAKQAKKHLTKYREEIAIDATRALGRRLGDFLVLVNDFLPEDSFIVAGGVMSGETRRIAIKETKARAAKYGLRLQDLGSQLEVVSGRNVEHQASEVQETNVTSLRDNGCLGAASFAAGQFLLDRKRLGLNQLRNMVASMPTNATLTVSQKDVSFDAGGLAPLEVGEWALEYDEVIQFLKEEAESLQIYQSQGRPDHEVYTRWGD